MYVLKNAIANLGRNKGRNCLLGGMMFLILFTGTLSIMIYTATGNQIKVFENQFAASVILYRDDQKLQPTDEYREPTFTDLQNYATSKYLKHTELIASVPAGINNGKALDEERTDVSGFDKESIPGTSNYKVSTNMVFGTNNKTINSEFESGIRNLVQGTSPQKQNEAMISKPLAGLNHWKIGDIIELRFPNLSGTDSKPISMKITGIYEDKTKAYENEDLKMALTNRGNEIITTLETLTSQSNEMVNVVANFTINDPNNVAALEQDLHKMGLPNYFVLKTDDLAYQKAVAPLKSLQDVTKLLLGAVVIIGGAILVTLSILAIKERIYEVGILRAIGMKKLTLAFSFLWEGICLTGVCLLLAFGTAKVCSEPLAQTLFQSQSDSTTFTKEQGNQVSLGAIGGFNNGAGTKIETVKVVITSEMMLEIIALALFFATISSIGSMYFIMRYEPRRILSERS